MIDTRFPLWLPVNAFLQYLLVERQLSPKTMESYFRQLDILIAIASEMGLTEWQQPEVIQVRAWATSSKHQGLQPASMALRLSSLHNFLNWLVSIGPLGANPARRTAPLPASTENMDVDEVDHLLDIDIHDSLAQHDHDAMLEVIYGTELRLAELVGINCADVDLSGCEVLVVGKGNK